MPNINYKNKLDKENMLVLKKIIQQTNVQIIFQ